MKADTITEVVLSLVGDFQPRGVEMGDTRAFENLKTLCNVIDKLNREIYDIKRFYKDSPHFTAIRSYEYALKHLNELKAE